MNSPRLSRQSLRRFSAHRDAGYEESHWSATGRVFLSAGISREEFEEAPGRQRASSSSRYVAHPAHSPEVRRPKE